MILYKHLSINKFTINSLEENYIWFSSHENFNDPYDCKVRLAPPTKEDVQFCHHLRPNSKSIDKDDLLMLIDNAKRDLMDEYAKSMGVSCFTSNKNNILMWSHYSNKHFGISLGFETDELYMKSQDSSTGNTIILYPEEIKYSDFYPEITLPFVRQNFQFIEAFKNIFLTKAKVWSYECEWRCISFEAGMHTFNKSSLKEVIFGVKTNIDDKKKIFDLIKKLGYINVQFYNCELNPTQYSLDIVPYSI